MRQMQIMCCLLLGLCFGQGGGGQAIMIMEFAPALGNIVAHRILGRWRGRANGFCSITVSSRSVTILRTYWCDWVTRKAHLSESFAFPCAFFLFGAGILHSMEKATQLVHGTPRLAASHRTYWFVNADSWDGWWAAEGTDLSCMAGLGYRRRFSD